MKLRIIAICIATFFAGVGLASLVFLFQPIGKQKDMSYSASENEHNGHDMDAMQNEMDGMTENLQRKIGVEFEKAFLKDMIIHHEGAIEMAQMLKVNTTRPELLELAEDIISAQKNEVEMMKGWQKDWGFE